MQPRGYTNKYSGYMSGWIGYLSGNIGYMGIDCVCERAHRVRRRVQPLSAAMAMLAGGQVGPSPRLPAALAAVAEQSLCAGDGGLWPRNNCSPDGALVGGLVGALMAVIEAVLAVPVMAVKAVAMAVAVGVTAAVLVAAAVVVAAALVAMTCA